MRVAISQFTTTSNVQENLASCAAMINDIAVCKPSLIVLPEYCNTAFSNPLLEEQHLKDNHLDDNHLDDKLFHETQSSYLDHNQAWNEALLLEGTFLQSIAKQAKAHQCYIAINVTLRRSFCADLANENQVSINKSPISVTTCLFSPSGELIHQQNKQTLTKHEQQFFSAWDETVSTIPTSLGKLGFLIGYDSMTFAAPRNRALQGAQLLCNSTSSLSLDQSDLHNPARAFENNVFIASANKFGNSQIVSPAGKVLVKLAHNKTGFVFVDIDLASNNTAIGLDNKYRPDGTAFFKQRRPELYQTPLEQTEAYKVNTDFSSNNASIIPETANVAIFATYKSNQAAIEDVCHYIENNLSDITQLPELFFVDDKTITQNVAQRAEIENLSELMVAQVSAVLRPFQYVCTSLIVEGIHQAVIISKQGILAKQAQLHFCQRYQWSTLGSDINIIELPLEQGNIKVAMLTADDANIPEIVKYTATKGIHVLLVPFDIQETCEVEYSLIARAAENRLCIVAASREKSFANDLPAAKKNDHDKKKIKTQKSTGFIANLTKNFPSFEQLNTIKFKGFINHPLIKYQQGKITKSLVYPIAACNKYQS